MKRLREIAFKNRSGFTLLELMVVMVILVLLASTVTVVIIKRVQEAKRAKAVVDVEALGSALDQFYLHCGRYPTTEEGLGALRVQPNTADLQGLWNGPYIQRAVPNDPWNKPYNYLCPGQHNPDSYDLYSLGPTGKEGGEGADAPIVNWEQ